MPDTPNEKPKGSSRPQRSRNEQSSTSPKKSGNSNSTPRKSGNEQRSSAPKKSGQASQNAQNSARKRTASPAPRPQKPGQNLQSLAAPAAPAAQPAPKAAQKPRSPRGKTPMLSKGSIFIGLGVLVVVALSVWLYVSFSLTHKVLFQYRDENNRVVKVTIKDAIEEIKPLLPQAPQEAVDELQNGTEGVKNVVMSVSLYPRLMLAEAIKISNFRESDAYKAGLSNYLSTLPISLAYNKGLEEVNKTIDGEKIRYAGISRIFIKKTAEIDEAAKDRATRILTQLKSATNGQEAFTQAAMASSEEPIGRQNGGYFGEVLRGTYPTLDPVLFDKAAPEGLYSELVEGPEAYYLLYVHTPAQEGALKDLPQLQNSPVRYQATAAYLDKNTEILYTYTSNTLLNKGKPAAEDSLTAKSTMAKFWNKSYTAEELGVLLVTLSPAGTVAPQPLELVQLLSDTNAPYRARLAVLTKNYRAGAGPNKEYSQASNTYVRTLDQRSTQEVLQNYLKTQVETNISSAEYQGLYGSLPEKPIKDYKADGSPIYASMAESIPQLTEQILGYRSQMKLQELLTKASAERGVQWKDHNLESFKDVFNKEYNKIQSAQK